MDTSPARSRPSGAKSKRFAVVGGGVSGMAAAYYLREQGFEAEVIEQDDQLGGRIGSCKLGDRWVDFGGKNIGRSYDLFRQFTRAMGDNPYEFFGINSSRVDEGRILTLDSTRRWRGLLEYARRSPWTDVLRFARLCACVKWDDANGYLGSSFFKDLAKRTDDSTLSDYFNEKFCKMIVRPMTVRMNGAEPDEFFLGNLGTNIRMILDTYDQLRYGTKGVLDQFAATGPMRLNTRAEAVIVSKGRAVGLRVVQKDGSREDLPYDGVILATPAVLSARLIEPHHLLLARHLEKVRYYPVAVILAEYERQIFSPKIRALVFGEEEALSNAGAYSVNDLHIVRYTFSGRTARQVLAWGGSDESLLSSAEEALNRYIPVRPSERVRFIARRFDPGLCAYTPHFSDFVESLRAGLRQISGLFLAGDYLQGASIEACFRSSRACVMVLAQTHPCLS